VLRFCSHLGAIGLVGVASVALSGCIIAHDTGTTSGGTAPPPGEQSVQIDPGGALTTDPGSGVAILVEHESGTRWNVQTTCDTVKSGAPCSFEIFTRSPGITLATTSQLEPNDFVDQGQDNLHAVLQTSTGIDAFSFDAAVGQSVELEVYLDGESAARYVFWVGRGVTHAGIATNPALFVPK